MSIQRGSWCGAFLAIGLFATPAFAADDEEKTPDVETATIATIEPDVIYGRVDALAMTYDLLKPTAEPNGATVIFMVSGGWISRWFDPRMALAPEIRGISLVHDLLVDGYHVVLLRHGSSPRYKVPDAVDHVEEAIRHIRNAAPERDLDPERIGAFGLSAGGHLTLHLATLGGREASRDLQRQRMESGFRGPRRSAPIAAAVAWFPPVDLVPFVGPNDRFPAMDFDPEEAERVSPLRHVDNHDAPVLLMHGSEDTVVMVESSEVMKAAYDAAGLEAEYHRFEGAGHMFRGRDAARSSRLAKAWFDRWLVDARSSEDDGGD